jgi:sulfatase maturation enzyme AslB (radical SAM superfamily)
MTDNFGKMYENKELKLFASPTYNYHFNKKTGLFARWGKTEEDDPTCSPFGPEILDIEISSGHCRGNCSYCYKGNSASEQHVTNMTFEGYSNILDKLTSFLTQVAFGICDIDTNPDFFKMMRYTRDKGIIPNYTTNGIGLKPEHYKLTAELCGAVAVSYKSREITYDVIQKFGEYGCDKVNMHYVMAEETFEEAMQVISDAAVDPRLKNLYAIVFLKYKPKGNNPNVLTTITDPTQYRKVYDYACERNITIGFDSCTCCMFEKSLEGHSDKEKIVKFTDPCESSLFSAYINCKGEFSPCSFCEGEGTWIDGINVLGTENFMKDVWYHPRTNEFRKKLISNNRRCPVFALD